jgi:hypothetical protein
MKISGLMGTNYLKLDRVWEDGIGQVMGVEAEDELDSLKIYFDCFVYFVYCV